MRQCGCADYYHRMGKLSSPYVDWLWLGDAVTLSKDWPVRGTVIPIEMFKMCLCSLLPSSALDTVILLIFKLGFWSTRLFQVISGEIKVPWLRIKSKRPCVLNGSSGLSRWVVGALPRDSRETAWCCCKGRPWEQKAEQVSFIGCPGGQHSRRWKNHICFYRFHAPAERPVFFL